MSDSEDTLDELREQKRKELRDRAHQQQQQQADDVPATTDDDQREQKDAILKQILSEDARQRLNAVRMANAERAEAVENQLIRLAQTGRLQEQLDDDQMKDLLKGVADKESNDFNIRRR